MLVYKRVVLGEKDYVQLHLLHQASCPRPPNSSDLNPRRKGTTYVHQWTGVSGKQRLSDEAKGLFLDGTISTDWKRSSPPWKTHRKKKTWLIEFSDFFPFQFLVNMWTTYLASPKSKPIWPSRRSSWPPSSTGSAKWIDSIEVLYTHIVNQGFCWCIWYDSEGISWLHIPICWCMVRSIICCLVVAPHDWKWWNPEASFLCRKEKTNL